MMGSSAAAAREEAAAFLGGVDMRLLAARTATGALARAAGAGGEVVEKAARFEECIRSLEAEKAKMEVFHRELPISVHLIADVIEWLKNEVEQQRLRRRAAAPEMFAPPPTAKRKAAEDVKAEAEANDKRSWMSSAQLWSCGSHTSTSTSNGGSVKKQQQHKVSNAFMPLATLPASVKSPEKTGGAGATPLPAAVPDLSLSSPAATTDAPACPAAPSATSSAVTDVDGAQRRQQQQLQQQAVQRKARRCWSPELHRRFVAALQRLGGPQAATPKQIRELMKVDGLTNDEVKSHLQKYRLHTRRASDGGGGDHQTAGGCLWQLPPEQYATSQHSTSQSGSPQGPLQLTVSSSHAMSVTAGGDSCDGGDEEEGEEEDGKSESYSWEMQNGARASSSS